MLGRDADQHAAGDLGVEEHLQSPCIRLAFDPHAFRGELAIRDEGEGFPETGPPAAKDKTPAAGEAESGDPAEVKKLAAMVAVLSEGILAMQQTLQGLVGQAFQPDV